MTIQGISDNVDALLKSTGFFESVLNAWPTSLAHSGYPLAIHYYTDGESQYATVSQNRRVFQYTIDIILVVGKDTTATDQYKQAYSLIDSVIDLFDQSIDLSSETIQLSKACDILRPAPGRLEEIETEAGEGLKMTVTLFCEADVTFRNS